MSGHGARCLPLAQVPRLGVALSLSGCVLLGLVL